MGAAYPLVRIPRGPEKESLVSGAFPVGKDRDSDRHITDRRRANWAERGWPNGSVLPHAMQMAYRILHEGEQLEMWIFDLPDY